MVGSLALIMLVLLFLASLGTPGTMVSISIESEIVQIQVVNPGAATIAIPSGRNLANNQCFTGVSITAEVGSRVSYIRQRGQELIVLIDGPAQWIHDGLTPNDQPLGSPEILRFAVEGGSAVMPATTVAQSTEAMDNETAEPPYNYKLASIPVVAGCNRVDRIRLPVNGIAVFGDDLKHVTQSNASPPLLLSGRMMVFGRATSKFGNVFRLDFGPFQEYGLYFAQEFAIPGGARIGAMPVNMPTSVSASDASGNQGQGAEASKDTDALIAHWYGFADIVFKSDEADAISIAASSNASKVGIYLPVPFRTDDAQGGSRADIISLSLLARLTGDPNLMWIYGLMLLLISIMTFASFFARK